jgi:hypothetical protein
MPPQYHVYQSDTAGQPIDNSAPVATAAGTGWLSGSLGPGTWSFGARAFDIHGEEQNLDCAVTITLDANGNDVTNRPAPPVGLRAFATAGGGIRAEWFSAPVVGATAPTQFHVYIGTGGTPNYATPVAAVAYNAGIFNTFAANIGPLAPGTYSVGVRAANPVGEEPNTTAIQVLADATGPAAVDSLIATAIV